MTTEIPMARRDQIALRLTQGESVVSNDLAEEFGVSEDAIRRDLRALAAQGACRRVYGGALPITPATRPMSARAAEDMSRKQALARAAAVQVQRGEFLFLDSGSTNLALVGFLPEDLDITVATNSVDIAAALLQRADLRLFLVGGLVDLAVGGCVDASAVQSLSGMNIDRCFLGSCATSPESGVCTYDHADALFKRALLAASRHCVALVTNEKFDTRAPHRVAAIKDLDMLVVEHDAPPKAVQAMKRAGTSVLRAEQAI